MSTTNVGGKKRPDRALQKVLDAYQSAGGNIAQGAALIDMPRTTFYNYLEDASVRFGIQIKPVADGKINSKEPLLLKKPRRGRVKRFIITSEQNNTHAHPGHETLRAYRKWLERDGDSCRLMSGTFSYKVSAYGSLAVKRGKAKSISKLWYDESLEDIVCDDVLELAPGLVYAGNWNELPTGVDPLRAMDRYGGRKSVIVPHVKQHMQSVAALQSEPVKFLYSTGTITQKNYIQKRAGIIAEQGTEHTFGAVLVEVDSDGAWYVRQLVVGPDNEVYDIGPEGVKPGCVLVKDGKVTQGHQAEAVNWGDLHAAEMEKWVRELAFAEGGMLDSVRPKHQFDNDLHSQRSRNHHDVRDWRREYEKWRDGHDRVWDELLVTADLVNEQERPWCQTHVVRSNHHEHPERWIQDADWREDPANARIYLELALAMVTARDEKREDDFVLLEHALRKAGIPDAVHFLRKEESYVICPDFGGGIECALHGDRGINGSRGSTRGLRKLGRRVNKGHDHTAYLDQGGVGSAGACSLDFPYMDGPTTHSVSHITTFPNSARQITTFWRGKYRA